MKAKIEVQMDNAAFEPETELARILRRLATRIETEGDTTGALLDANGNTVGQFKITR